MSFRNDTNVLNVLVSLADPGKGQQAAYPVAGLWILFFSVTSYTDIPIHISKCANRFLNRLHQISPALQSSQKIHIGSNEETGYGGTGQG